MVRMKAGGMSSERAARFLRADFRPCRLALAWIVEFTSSNSPRNALEIPEMAGEADLGMFEGKVVLVTGGGAGMGKSAAQRFAQEGAKVLVVDLNIEAAETTAGLIREGGGEASTFRADIASQADNDAMVAEAVDRYGQLDAAFLNAAYLGPVLDFFETDAATFDKIVNINLRGCFFGMQACARAMQPGGAIVVNASTAAFAANQYNAV
jgi:NAD(P)-dependent dehydrogenase (short-subunit alcohol dehydrogenase family)